MTPSELASRIDHTVLKPESTPTDIDTLIAECREHQFASACVNGVYVAKVHTGLEGSGVKTCSVVGFPLGAGKAFTKAIEATQAVKDGADEIDFVAHLPKLMAKDLTGSRDDFIEIVKAARATNPQVVIKVIIESAALAADVDDAEFEARVQCACEAAKQSGIDFVKTSTGFHAAGGASEKAVELMKKHSGGLYVKASGGIRSYDDAMRMINAGADRLGCSASIAIAQGAAGDGEY